MVWVLTYGDCPPAIAGVTAVALKPPTGALSSLPASRRDPTKSVEDALMFQKEIYLTLQQTAGSSTHAIVDVNVGWQELSANLPSARTSDVLKAIGLK